LRLTRTLYGIKHGSTWKKKKIIVQRRRGLTMLHFPIPLARNKDPKAILIGCAACTIILVYTLLAARKRLL